MFQDLYHANAQILAGYLLTGSEISQSHIQPGTFEQRAQTLNNQWDSEMEKAIADEDTIERIGNINDDLQNLYFEVGMKAGIEIAQSLELGNASQNRTERQGEPEEKKHLQEIKISQAVAEQNAMKALVEMSKLHLSFSLHKDDTAILQQGINRLNEKLDRLIDADPDATGHTRARVRAQDPGEEPAEPTK